MDDKFFTVRIARKWLRLASILGVAALIVAPLAALAAFDDVPESHTFHDDIEWLQASGVTKGCNPPDNTLFCPEDNVTRAQMSAFMRRFAQYLDAEDGTPGQADTLDGHLPEELSVQGWVRVAGNTVTLDANGEFGSSQADCPAGTRLTGGGHSTTDGVPNINVFRSWPVSDTRWEATGEKVAGPAGRTFRAHAICAIVNP